MKKSIKGALALVAAVTLCLTACGSSTSAINISRSTDTTEMDLSAVNDTLTAKLTGIPSTGYEWTYEMPNDALIELTKTESIDNKTDSAMTGTSHTDVYTFKGLVIDFSARIVTVDGVRVDMTPKEYELLFYMVRNKGLALTRESLISEVWGYDFFGDERTLDTHIKLLRKSLGAYSKCIVTLRGVGYRFEEVH